MTNILFSARQGKQLFCLVTIDFSRAFDCINFDFLLVALRKCGVSELACKWFESCLSNRSQCTKYFGTLSDPLPIISDVPKSSILGLVLFNVYLNRLLKLLPGNCAVAFADDHSVLY